MTFLSPLSADCANPFIRVAVPPPPSFRPIIGEPRNVRVSFSSTIPSVGNTAARRSGLRYERRALEFLSSRFPGLFIAPMFRYSDDSGARLCIPDAILFDPARVVIFEIKHQHVADAWWQLEKLYKPVVSKYSPRPIQLVEVCKTFDPQTPFPCDFELLSSDIPYIDSFGVFPWKP